MLNEICLTQKDLHMTHEAARAVTIRIIEKNSSNQWLQREGNWKNFCLVGTEFQFRKMRIYLLRSRQQ